MCGAVCVCVPGQRKCSWQRRTCEKAGRYMCYSLVAVIIDLNALLSSMEPDPMRSENILDAAENAEGGKEPETEAQGSASWEHEQRERLGKPSGQS